MKFYDANDQNLTEKRRKAYQFKKYEFNL